MECVRVGVRRSCSNCSAHWASLSSHSWKEGRINNRGRKIRCAVWCNSLYTLCCVCVCVCVCVVCVCVVCVCVLCVCVCRASRSRCCVWRVFPNYFKWWTLATRERWAPSSLVSPPAPERPRRQWREFISSPNTSRSSLADQT